MSAFNKIWKHTRALASRTRAAAITAYQRRVKLVLRSGVTILACLFAFHFRATIANWCYATGSFLYARLTAHPEIGRFVHIVINIFPDLTSVLIAIAGLGYLFPTLVKLLERNVKPRKTVAVVFIAFSLLSLMVNAINRAAEDQKAELNSKTLSVVLQSVNNVQMALKAPNMSEADRRKHILTALRDEYLLSHNPVDPEILSGTKAPPEDWLNKRLRDLNENWTIKNEPDARVITTAPVRSYLTFPDAPKLAGGLQENENFTVGERLMFNIHFKVVGPNPLQLISQASYFSFESDSSARTQTETVNTFRKKISSREEGVYTSLVEPETMMPAEDQFLTVPVPLVASRLSTEDLNALHTGSKVAFVLNEFTYKDKGRTHHLRRCLMLQPPGTIPAIWQYCFAFNNSD